MDALNAMAREIARTDLPVLLLGESGPGKEVYARFIHQASLSSAPLRRINCASATPEALRESVLTPKSTDAAGTLFLDDVHDLDIHCQRMLVSVLSAEEPRNGHPRLPVRLISATSHDLEKAVDAGRFRRELYFRINGVTLSLPALRERKEDIPAFLEHFIAKHSKHLGKPAPTFDGAEMEALKSHGWPGNIRELENMAKKVVVLGRTQLVLSELRPASPVIVADSGRIPSLKIAARAASRQTERELILKALERTRWNRKRAAQDLQISYKSLLYKLKQIGIPE